MDDETDLHDALACMVARAHTLQGNRWAECPAHPCSPILDGSAIVVHIRPAHLAVGCILNGRSPFGRRCNEPLRTAITVKALVGWRLEARPRAEQHDSAWRHGADDTRMVLNQRCIEA